MARLRLQNALSLGSGLLFDRKLSKRNAGARTVRSPYLPTRTDKSRQEMTRADKIFDKKVLDTITDIYNIIYYILHLFAPVRIPYTPPVYGFFFIFINRYSTASRYSLF